MMPFKTPLIFLGSWPSNWPLLLQLRPPHLNTHTSRIKCFCLWIPGCSHIKHKPCSGRIYFHQARYQYASPWRIVWCRLEGLCEFFLECFHGIGEVSPKGQCLLRTSHFYLF